MADSLSDKNKTLVADLRRNLAAAQLEAGDFEGALTNCDALLKASAGKEDDKARYRRTVALQRLGRIEEAQRELGRFAAVRGEHDTAVRRLRAELGAHGP